MAASVPTGCFKCGRPGHWSKDCSSSSANPNPNSKFSSSKFTQQSATPSEKPSAASSAKKAPRTRPKLTPDLLLSDGGLGYILRHFPRSFKNHGRGHEVTDLGNLIGLYAEWHSRLLPYYSFDQFVHKVEQVGTTKRVRRCVSELRERVARGEDPTKLNEPPPEEVDACCEQGVDMEDQNVDAVDPPLESHVADGMHEEMINEVYQMATNEPCSSLHEETREASQRLERASITGEQKARMEANRQKALERAAARARSTRAL